VIIINATTFRVPNSPKLLCLEYQIWVVTSTTGFHILNFLDSIAYLVLLGEGRYIVDIWRVHSPVPSFDLVLSTPSYRDWSFNLRTWKGSLIRMSDYTFSYHKVHHPINVADI
jgi:hypothetical protein